MKEIAKFFPSSTAVKTSGAETLAITATIEVRNPARTVLGTGCVTSSAVRF